MNENESFYEYEENLFGFDYTQIFDSFVKAIYRANFY